MFQNMTILMAGITQVLEQVRELGSRFGVKTFWNLGGSGVYAAQLAHTRTLQGSRWDVSSRAIISQ